MTVEPMSSQRYTCHLTAAHTERPGRSPARRWGAARRTLGLIGAAMALVVFAPGVADAASGSWLSPSPPPLESELVSPNEAPISDVAFDGSGKAYAVWVYDEGATAANHDKGEHYDVMFAGRPPGGSWSAPQVIDQVASTSAYFEQVRIAVDSSGDAVIAWRENGEIGVAERAASAATWTVGLTPLAGGVASENFGLGMDGSGDVTVVWTAASGSPSPGVYAIRRTAGSWDHSPTRVDEHEPPGVGTPSLAVDSNGDALIAYVLLTEEGKGMALNVVSRGANELAWSAPHEVHSLGAADKCEPGMYHLNNPQAAISNSGRAAVIWQNECHADNANNYFAPDEVSVREAGTWSAPTTLQENGYWYSAHPQVAIDPTGKLTAIWTPGSVPGSGSNNADLMSSELPAGLSAESSTNWGAPETIATLTDSTETAPAIATDAGGDVALAFGGYGDQTYVSYHAAGGTTWTTESEGSKAGSVYPAIAIAPSGGALAVWNKPNGKEIGSGSGYLDYEEAAAAFDAGPTLGTVQIPPNGYTSQQLTFSAKASGDWSPPASVTWDFGDGTTAEGASVTHTYQEAGEYTVTVTATDQAGNTATRSATSHIVNDEGPPTITISTPASNQQLVQGQVVDASYSCQDSGSGVASCAGPAANGAQLDTSQTGSFSFEVSAADNVGNTATLTHDYTVLASQAPTVVSAPASGISGTAATLNATVDPNGSQVSSCELQYGTSSGYGSVAACSPSPGSGSTAVSVSASVSGLVSGTTYHFRVVATNAGGTSDGSDQTFTTLEAPTVVTGTASGVSDTGATLGGTVDPHDSDVNSCVFQYDTTGLYQSPESVPCSSLPLSGSGQVSLTGVLSGLAAGMTYHFRIVATNAAGTSNGADQTFTTLQAPTVVTGTASGVSETGATLSGTVDPHTSDVSSCQFDYGITSGYGSQISCSSLPSAGSGQVSVTGALTGLSPGTTYHFRIVATSAGGTSYGGDQTFTTQSTPGPVAPTAVTAAAGAISAGAATLNATVDANGSDVSSCVFQYDTTGLYQSPASVPCSSLPASGSGQVSLTGVLSGLTAGTTYHFRVVATNAGGTSDGGDVTFTTLAPPTVLTGTASAVTNGGATVSASVDPNGSKVTVCTFEYGTGSGYGSSAPCSSSPGSGTGSVVVSGVLGGLTSGTTYHFAVIATNAAGTSTGKDATFRTPAAPAVSIGSVSAVSQTTATVIGTVDPNGGNVTLCELQYGTTTGYGSSPVPCSASPGSGIGPVGVTAVLSGLTPGTGYHVRLVASNAAGTSYGADRTFTTQAATAAVSTACTQHLSFGPVQVSGSCLHRQGLTWTSSGSVSFAGINLVPNGAGAEIVIDPLNLRVEAKGSVSVVLGPATVAGHEFGPYTVFKGGFDWIFQGQVSQALTNRLYQALGNLEGRGKGGGVPSYPAVGFPPAIVKLPDLSGVPAIPTLRGLGIPDFSRITSAKQLSELAGLGSQGITIPGLGGANVTFPRSLIPDVSLPQTCVSTDQVSFIGQLPLQGQACVTIANNVAKIVANVDLGALLAHTSAAVALTVHPDGSVTIDNAVGQIGAFTLGPVKFDQTNFRYDGAQDSWHADAGATLGFFGNASVKASLDLQGGQIVNGSVQLNGGQYGVPVGPVMLNALGFQFHTTPAPTFLGGTIGFGFGPTAGNGRLLQLNGSATATFGNAPKLDLSADLAAGGTKIGHGQFDYDGSTGTVSAKLTAGYTTPTVEVLGGKHDVSISGALSGFVSIPAGQFQVDGGAQLVLDPSSRPITLLGAHATVSNKGFAACGEAGGWGFEGNAGVGYLFATHKFSGWLGFGSCGLSAYQVRATASAARVAPGARTVTIAPNQPEISLGVRGAGGAPEVVLAGPRGARIVTSAANPLDIEPDHITYVDQAGGMTTIILARPAAGRWTVTPQQGSVPIAEIGSAHELPDPAIRATVTHHRGHYILAYRLHPLAGQRITFREQYGAVAHTLASTDAASGRIAFTPAPGSGGRREIIASVTQDQLPREQKTVARYIAPKVRRLRAPRHARVYRIRNRVRVSWRPVAGAARYLVTVRYNSGVRRQLATKSAKPVTLGGVLANDPVSVTIVAISATEHRGAIAHARAARHLPKPHHPHHPHPHRHHRHHHPHRHHKPSRHHKR